MFPLTGRIIARLNADTEAPAMTVNPAQAIELRKAVMLPVNLGFASPEMSNASKARAGVIVQDSAVSGRGFTEDNRVKFNAYSSRVKTNDMRAKAGPQAGTPKR
jgi:hypothetical protein